MLSLTPRAHVHTCTPSPKATRKQQVSVCKAVCSRAHTVHTSLEARPQAIRRVMAAAYIGVGVSKFDELVADGRMPRPKRIDRRKVWDIRELDLAFDDLPSEPGKVDHSWDDIDALALDQGAKK